jgi:hypothetical protein
MGPSACSTFANGGVRFLLFAWLHSVLKVESTVLHYADATWESTYSLFAQRHHIPNLDNLAAEEIRKLARAEIDAHAAREAAGLVPYRSTVYPMFKRPASVVLKKDPSYLGKWPKNMAEDEMDIDGDGSDEDTGGVALKDFQLTGLNWLAYCWSRAENGILADEVSLSVSPR